MPTATPADTARPFVTPRPEFAVSEFAVSEFTTGPNVTAEEKHAAVTGLVAWIESGFARDLFTDPVYLLLTGPLAIPVYYNMEEFRQHWTAKPSSRAKLLGHIITNLNHGKMWLYGVDMVVAFNQFTDVGANRVAWFEEARSRELAATAAQDRVDRVARLEQEARELGYTLTPGPTG